MVAFAGGRTARAALAGVDGDGDLAVLTVETGDAPAIEWGGRGALGSAVFAVANPGGRGPRVTLGFVSSVSGAFRGPGGRRIAGTIEHTAALPRGSSGGPVVDAEGRFVGLNTNRLGEGFYAAIPADDALRARVDALGRGESPSKRRLGVGVAPPHVARRLRRAVGLPERDGLLIRHVEEGSPAANAGIQRGDLLVEAGAVAVTGVDDLWTAMDAAEGGALQVRLVRGTEERTVAVSFPDAGAPTPPAATEA
jgi:serine protease Do